MSSTRRVKQDAPPEYSSLPEVASRLRVGNRKVLKWIADGEIHASNIAARADARPCWRISADDLAQFLARRSSPAPAAPAKHRRRSDDTYIRHYS